MNNNMLLVCSKKMAQIPAIEIFTQHQIAYKRLALNENTCAIAGWGRKASFFRAQQLAETKRLDCICLEDGFIRSLGLGKQGFPPLSLVVDHSGIYFDATQSSDLEKLILSEEVTENNDRAQRAIATIVKYGITKYNQNYRALDPTKFQEGIHILLVDQTYGDQSIRYAGADSEAFKKMLQVAKEQHPEATIWVKTHPDVVAGKAKGYFNVAELKQQGIRVLSENYNPIELLQQMDDVYVVSSQMGFEALLCGKTVHCFGIPWYAGWGLTNDSHAPVDILQERRTQHRTIEHLFASAYFHYARYVSPLTQQLCELEDILDLFIPNIEFQKRFQKQIVAYGFSRWKRQFIADYLDYSHIQLRFKQWSKPNKNEQVVAWGKKANLLKAEGYQNVCTVEDGFIRSTGLGATLIRPHSLVFDDIGIYYDATRPSRLENLLNESALTAAQLQRARNLIQQLIDLQVSKYNVGQSSQLQRPEAFSKVLLVVGQVEDDMSILLGGVDIKQNLQLLQKVRQNYPDAYIIYKPHPDVQAGLRVGKIANDVALQYANVIEVDHSILECFKICDEVHTITSLSGFEALMRGLIVYCYGLPFYAGWGLTQDQHECHRRTKKLSLEQLVYITLVQYPVYNIEITEKMRVPLVQPEKVIDLLQPSKRQPIPHQSLLAKIFTSFRRLKTRK
ncbi:MAG: capsular polysaccharide biosynthesis protein [Acinetobacter sp.]